MLWRGLGVARVHREAGTLLMSRIWCFLQFEYCTDLDYRKSSYLIGLTLWTKQNRLFSDSPYVHNESIHS